MQTNLKANCLEISQKCDLPTVGFFSSFTVSTMHSVLLFLSSFTLKFDLTSFFCKKLKNSCLLFVCKQSRQTAVPDILRKSVSVSYSVLAFFVVGDQVGRFKVLWSARFLFSSTKTTNLAMAFSVKK